MKLRTSWMGLTADYTQLNKDYWWIKITEIVMPKYTAIILVINSKNETWKFTYIWRMSHIILSNLYIKYR